MKGSKRNHLYDTNTAQMIAGYDTRFFKTNSRYLSEALYRKNNGEFFFPTGDFCHFEETLYQKRTGDFFCLGMEDL